MKKKSSPSKVLNSNPPEIGSLFQVDGRFYRVNGWVREFPYKLHPTNTGNIGMDIMSEIVNERLIQTGKLGKFYQKWCLPEQATHVEGVGICGGVFKISEVTWEGKICDIPAEHLEIMRELALARGRAGVRIG